VWTDDEILVPRLLSQIRIYYEFLQENDGDSSNERDYIKYCKKSSLQQNSNYVEISKNNLQRIMEDLTNVTKERNFLLNKLFHQEIEITLLKSNESNYEDEEKKDEIKS